MAGKALRIAWHRKVNAPVATTWTQIPDTRRRGDTAHFGPIDTRALMAIGSCKPGPARVLADPEPQRRAPQNSVGLGLVSARPRAATPSPSRAPQGTSAMTRSNLHREGERSPWTAREDTPGAYCEAS